MTQGVEFMAGTGKNRRRAFTLVEVLLVVVIIATLASIAVVALWPQKEGFDKDATQLKIEKVMQALNLYRLQLGYPTADQGLKALLEKPTFDDPIKDKAWRGPYLIQSLDDLKDQWQHDLIYKLDDVQDTSGTTHQVAHVYSFGPNGQDDSGEGDDIKNKAWEAETANATH